MNEKNINLDKLFAKGVFFTLASKAVTIPCGIAIAYILGASDYGIYALIILIAQYMSYGNLGIFNGLTREVPIAKGGNTLNEKKEIYDSVYTFLIFSSLLVSLILPILYFFDILAFEGLSLYLILLILLIYFSGNFESFLYNSLKGENNLGIWTKYVSFKPALEAIIGLILVYLYGITGMVFAVIISRIVAILLLLRSYKGASLSIKFSSRIFKLLHTGIPLMISNLLKTTFTRSPIIFGSSVLAAREFGAIAYLVNNLGLSEKMPTGGLFALNNRNDIAGKLNKETNKKNLIKYTLEKDDFLKHIIFSGAYGGLLSIFYLYAINIFLDDYSISKNSIIYISIFFLSLSMFNFVSNLLDILRYLYLKIILFCLSIASFILLLNVTYKTEYINYIEISFMTSGLILLNLMMLSLFFKGGGGITLINLVKFNLFHIFYFYSLSLSMGLYYILPSILFDDLYISSFSAFLISCLIFMLSFALSSLILYHKRVIKLILSKK